MSRASIDKDALTEGMSLNEAVTSLQDSPVQCNSNTLFFSDLHAFMCMGTRTPSPATLHGISTWYMESNQEKFGGKEACVDAGD